MTRDKDIAISFIVLFCAILVLTGLNIIHTVVISDMANRVKLLEEGK